MNCFPILATSAGIVAENNHVFFSSGVDRILRYLRRNPYSTFRQPHLEYKINLRDIYQSSVDHVLHSS
jgi:hypothetical protein